MRRVFLFLLLLLTAQISFSQSGHQISGFVREENSNNPVQSVALDVLSAGTRAAPPVVSGMDGEFKFAGLRDGDYYIVATKKGYDTITVEVSIMAGIAPPVLVSMHKQGETTVTGTTETVSARQLGIPAKAKEFFDKGYKLLYEKSEPQKSIALFQRAIELYPSYYESYTQVGVADYRLNQSAEAEKALRKAIEISSGKYPDALFLLAQMLNDQQRFAEAEGLSRQAIEAGDPSWHSHFELARALVGLKRGPEAEASAVRARDLKSDNAPVYLLLANVHLQEQKFSAVVEDFDEYLKLAPNAPGSDQIRQRRDRMREALRVQPQPPTPKQ